MSEFDLIRRYFTRTTPGAVLGVGDDAALLQVAEGMTLAVSTDMLVSGTHFFPDAAPYWLGHKTLAVNLSDMAAMGAKPRWATLSLSLPQADSTWLQAFSEGFWALADIYGVELVGGDTTRGPLNLCVTIMGEVPAGAALRRDGAQPGDDIWVSGPLGRAALALAYLQGRMALPEAVRASCFSALHQPQPRVELGLALRGVAHSTIDISDGFLADLGHILECSKVAAEVQHGAMPMSGWMRRQEGNEQVLRCLYAGGDDYELCFTAPQSKRGQVEALAVRLRLPLARVGKIIPGQGCTVHAADGSVMRIEEAGYDHFVACK